MHQYNLLNATIKLYTLYPLENECDMSVYSKVGATIPCAATGEKYALSGAVQVEV